MYHGHVPREGWSWSVGDGEGPCVDYLAAAGVGDFDGLAGGESLGGEGAGWDGGHDGLSQSVVNRGCVLGGSPRWVEASRIAFIKHRGDEEASPHDPDC